MPRPAPSVSRVVEVLSLLGDTPRGFLSLSEIARRLDLNKATAHGILAVLLERGYVIRDPEDNGYRLGPAITSLGRATIWRPYEAVRVARLEMEQLADAARTACVATTRVGDEIIVTAVAGTPRGPDEVYLEMRGRFLPPVGTVFAAWGPPAVRNQWLTGEPLTDEERDTLRESLAGVRDRGFSVSLFTAHRAELAHLAASLLKKPGTDAIRSAIVTLMSEMVRDASELADIRPERQYMPRQISAPVFDENGEVLISLHLHGPGIQPISGAEIRELGYALSTTAARVTRMIGGRPPVLEALADPMPEAA